MSAQQKTNSKQENNSSKNQTTTTKADLANGLDIDSLLNALEGDLTALDSETAVSLIDEWYTSLHKAKEPEIKEIASSLKELKQLVKSGKATGHEIGEVLTEVGEQTSNVASDTNKELKTPLQKLGKQLRKIGVLLGKAEEREQIEQIESLVETLEGDLTQIEPETAQGVIDTWYTLLHKSEDENLQEVAKGLKELKQLLKRKTAKGADFVEVLTKLGEQTQQVAAQAPRGFKGPIQSLSKLLSKAGKSLD